MVKTFSLILWLVKLTYQILFQNILQINTQKQLREQKTHSFLNTIIYSNNFQETKNVLYSQVDSSDIIELPFISCFALKINYSKLYTLASINSINYITSDTKVCGLIYNSKNFINIDNLYKRSVNNSNHTCVIIDTGIYPHIDFLLGRNRIVQFLSLHLCLSF